MRDYAWLPPPEPSGGGGGNAFLPSRLDREGGGKQRGQAGEFRVFGTKCEFGGLSFGTGGSS